MSASGWVQAFALARGLVYAVGFVGLWIWLAVLSRRWDPRLSFALPSWLAPFGWVLATAGGVLAIACITTFATRGKGTPAPFDAPREFVATGPYRFVRNPMYVGAGSVILGAGLVLRSPSMALLAVAFFLFFHLFVLLYEEPTLAGRFGGSYTAYRATVPRWLPRGLPRATRESPP